MYAQKFKQISFAIYELLSFENTNYAALTSHEWLWFENTNMAALMSHENAPHG